MLEGLGSGWVEERVAEVVRVPALAGVMERVKVRLAPLQTPR